MTDKIYESPDKGKTVYERDFGDITNRTLIKSDTKEFHFFASCFLCWATTDDQRDLPALIKYMESQIKYHKEGEIMHTINDVSYDLYYVPLPANAAYKISGYKPVVDGLLHLGTFR